MQPPKFWTRPAGLAAYALSPFGALYGAITARRMAQAGQDVAIPVICVGNFVAGGAGKTPTVDWLASRLSAAGSKAFIVSRGYGGKQVSPLRVDPTQHIAALVGDEPLMLAARHAVIVARDRLAGARLAKAEGADLVVLDDGMQNPALRKTVTLAVVDAATGIGNGFCLPAGPLRAPLARQLAFVDAIVMIGDGEAGKAVAAKAEARGLPIFKARLEPDPDIAARLAGRRVLAFAGIGRPSKFHATLNAIGANVAAFEPYPDHYPLSEAELADLAEEAKKRRLLPVTTEKDAARAGRQILARHFGDDLVVLPVKLEVAQEDALLAFLRERLARGK